MTYLLGIRRNVAKHFEHDQHDRSFKYQYMPLYQCKAVIYKPSKKILQRESNARERPGSRSPGLALKGCRYKRTPHMKIETLDSLQCASPASHPQLDLFSSRFYINQKIQQLFSSLAQLLGGLKPCFITLSTCAVILCP